ncbi:MAG: hypothetical protein RL322_1754 [Pseudomonadota bacterium]|jgi:nicotinamidase-related amidase
MSPSIEIGSRSALMIVDLQNDFLSPDGAYARGNAVSPEALAIVPRVTRVAQAMRKRGALITASRFTLWPDASGEPMISAHLRALRPFLRQGDFEPGSRGQALLEPIATLVHACVDKIAYSAFFGTQLDWLLRKTGIDTLVVCGITTNGGVATTARDAHVRDLNVVVLSDGCAAPSVSRHQAALADLASVASVLECDQLLMKLG